MSQSEQDEITISFSSTSRSPNLCKAPRSWAVDPIKDVRAQLLFAQASTARLPLSGDWPPTNSYGHVIELGTRPQTMQRRVRFVAIHSAFGFSYSATNGKTSTDQLKADEPVRCWRKEVVPLFLCDSLSRSRSLMSRVSRGPKLHDPIQRDW